MKKQLKELYVQYKSIDRDNYDSTEDFLADRRQANKELQEFMDKHGITDVEETIYTPNQLQFIADAEDNGCDIVYDYSGRCMYGDTCPAVYVDSHSDCKTTADTRIDSLGLGIVIYAPL